MWYIFLRIVEPTLLPLACETPACSLEHCSSEDNDGVADDTTSVDKNCSAKG